jgi:hypothetical protein
MIVAEEAGTRFVTPVMFEGSRQPEAAGVEATRGGRGPGNRRQGQSEVARVEATEAAGVQATRGRG